MSTKSILRAKDFREVSEVRADGKNRIVLKRVKRAGKAYRVFENSLGQLILDPVVTIPAAELWLFENKAALAAVQQGLIESAEGKLVEKPSLAGFADEE